MKGISLFIVPKHRCRRTAAGERNDVVLAGLNHKMGYRGTTNTLLNFGEGVHPRRTAGAVGYLVGEEHRGLTYMFHMMNEARIGVGFGAIALGYTGYRTPLDVRARPRQGRPLARQGPGRAAGADHRARRRAPDAAGRRSPTSRAALALGLYCARLVDEEQTAETADDRAEAHLLLDVLTPIAKAWPSQWCLARQRPRHPGARRLRLHPRLPGRAVLPRQPAQPDPRGHRTASRRWTCSAARSTMQGGAGLALLGATIAATTARAPRRVARLRRRPRRRRQPARRGHRDAVGGRRPEAALANAHVYLEAAGHIGDRLAVAGAGPRRRTARTATSTTASARPPATSSPMSCRAPAGSRPAGEPGHPAGRHGRPSARILLGATGASGTTPPAAGTGQHRGERRSAYPARRPPSSQSVQWIGAVYQLSGEWASLVPPALGLVWWSGARSTTGTSARKALAMICPPTGRTTTARTARCQPWLDPAVASGDREFYSGAGHARPGRP